MIGQYKTGEYKDEIIMKLNRLTKSLYRNKNVFVFPFIHIQDMEGQERQLYMHW